MGVEGSNSLPDGLTPFVDVRMVMDQMLCGEAKAYELLREAVGRGPGESGLLRATVPVWNQFILRKFNMSPSTIRRAAPRPSPAPAVAKGELPRSGDAADSSGAIPVTRPRSKKT